MRERPLYREAEAKQWAENVEYGAVRPLTLEESAEVEATVSRDRLLNSRNYKWKSDASIPPKPKARLCIAGQWDPVGDIRAAFLNGVPAPRKLYFRQPSGGIPSLQPGQLVEVLKEFLDFLRALSCGGPNDQRT